ncbi:MAG: hypothetical protein GQ534_04140 [Candidatus Delongbacteria bacterium]|nr:hypothetical protein [Candidatus Delongbacteria bacterium]
MQLFRNVFVLFIIVVFGYTVDLSAEIKKIEFSEVWSHSVNTKLFETNQIEEDSSKIKSLTTINYKLDDYFGKARRTKSSEVLEKYKNGKCIEKSTSGMLHKFKYNKKGNKVEETLTVNGKLLNKEVFTYNKENLLIDKSDYLFARDIAGKILYQYDGIGEMISEITYGGNGKVESKVIYEYNNNGDETIKVVYDLNGNVINKSIHKYDDKLRRVEYVVLEGDENLVFKTKYSYDLEGKLMLIELMDFEILTKFSFLFNKENGFIHEIIAEMGLELLLNNMSDPLDDILGSCVMYDMKQCFGYVDGKLTEMIDKDSSGAIKKKETYLYNKVGNVVERNILEGNKKIKSITEYDKNNYWVKITKYQNDIPIEVSERKIEYNK